jgi:hypothetical protein
VIRLDSDRAYRSKVQPARTTSWCATSELARQALRASRQPDSLQQRDRWQCGNWKCQRVLGEGKAPYNATDTAASRAALNCFAHAARVSVVHIVQALHGRPTGQAAHGYEGCLGVARESTSCQRVETAWGSAHKRVCSGGCAPSHNCAPKLRAWRADRPAACPFCRARPTALGVAKQLATAHATRLEADGEASVPTRRKALQLS